MGVGPTYRHLRRRRGPLIWQICHRLTFRLAHLICLWKIIWNTHSVSSKLACLPSSTLILARFMGLISLPRLARCRSDSRLTAITCSSAHFTMAQGERVCRPTTVRHCMRPAIEPETHETTL